MNAAETQPITAAYEPIGYCRRCGYRINPGICPECGSKQPRPRRTPPMSRGGRIVVRVALLIGVVGLGFAAYEYRDPLAVNCLPPRLTRALRDGDNWFANWMWCVNSSQRHLALDATSDEFDRRLSEFRAARVKALPHEYAGTYRSNLSNLRLSPNHEFLYSWSTCEADGHNFGRVVRASHDQVVLEPELSETDYGLGPGTVLYRVTWRSQQFLIEKSQMPQFLNAYNQREGGTPLWFLVRRGDPLTDEPRIPSVPDEFRDFLHPEPLHATVTAIDDALSVEPTESGGACYEVSMTINVGRSQGVFVGMTLYLIPADSYGELEITDVDAQTSRGRYCDCFDRDVTVTLPTVGTECSTFSPISTFFDGFAFADHPMMESEPDWFADPNASGRNEQPEP